MAVENFSTYTEADPNSRITKTATRVTWTDLTRNESAYVYTDKGVDFFDGDFTQFFAIRATGYGGSAGTVNMGAYWGLANLVDDWVGIDTANGDGLFLWSRIDAGDGDQFLYLAEIDGGTAYTAADDYRITVNTTYYIKIIRDESVGTYGTLYCYIYSDADRTTLVDTQTITLHSSKKDYRYLYSFCSADSGSAAWSHSGYTENLTIYEADAGYAATYPINELLRASGIKRTFWSGLGGLSVYQCELALGGMSTTYVSPIGSRDIPSAAEPSPKPTFQAGYTLSDYGLWLSRTTPDIIQKIFGHQPTFSEWAEWRKSPIGQSYMKWGY